MAQKSPRPRGPQMSELWTVEDIARFAKYGKKNPLRIK